MPKYRVTEQYLMKVWYEKVISDEEIDSDTGDWSQIQELQEI